MESYYCLPATILIPCVFILFIFGVVCGACSSDESTVEDFATNKV